MRDMIVEGCLGHSDNKEVEFQMFGAIRRKAHLCLQAGEQWALRLFFLFLQLPGGEGALDQHTSAEALGASAAKQEQKRSPSRMTSTNLATCMGPNLLSPPEEDGFPVVQAMGKVVFTS